MQPLVVNLKPSKILCLLSAFAHAVAIYAVYLAALNIVLQIILSSLIIFVAIILIRKYGLLLAKKSVKKIWFKDGKRLVYYCADGSKFIATIMLTSYSSKLMVVLCLAGRSKNNSIVIAKDMLSIQDYKKLVVYLKYQT